MDGDGHYLTVQPWSASFSTKDENAAAIAAWVRFPEMLIQYYKKNVLRAIGKVLKKFIKIDYNTKEAQRGKFALMAVELDLRKPLISKILVDERIRPVEYEDLPVVCYKCGNYDHNSHLCGTKQGSGDEGSARGTSRGFDEERNSGERVLTVNLVKQAFCP